MPSAAVTPTMRVHAWNIEFLATRHDVPFAGTFQPPNSASLTFRHVLDEMRLCFEIPYHDGPTNTSSSERHANVWDGLAFGLAGFLNMSEEGPHLHGPSSVPTFVHSSCLDQRVPAPPQGSPLTPEERPIIRYRLFHHRDCGLSTDELTTHLEAGCARHILKPVRRLEPRYLPPKKTSSDPRFAAYPLRKTTRARRSSQSPSKRSASGSVSPNKDSGTGQDSLNDEDDLPNMVAPPQSDIPADRARQTIAAFRSSCLVAARQCAVSGMGRSWCATPSIGPALQACHIVPQQHYHLYPDPEAVDGENEDESSRWSPRRLNEAWERTWAPENGILLLSHLHELFDARLFSIHPVTLRIRVFVPYDVIVEYHGRIAKVPSSVDRAALRHHYEMCCIENMAAKMTFIEQTTRLESGVTTSGKSSPFAVRPKLANVTSSGMQEAAPQSRNQNNSRSDQGTASDPSKRARYTQAPSDHHCPEMISDDTGSSSIDDGSPFTCLARSASAIDDWALASQATRGDQSGSEASRTEDADQPSTRKRSHSAQRLFDARTWARHDSCITPHNSKDFLSDVNWELRKFARRRIG